MVNIETAAETAVQEENLPILEEGPPLRKAPFKVRLAARVAVGGLSLLGRTWRLEWIRGELVEEWSRKGCIFAFWHGQAMIPAWAYRNKGVAVMVSLHRDGEIMNRALARLGFKRIRGSTSKGGNSALSAMAALLRKGGLAAITPDGPRGPRFKVHPGVFLLAARTGSPILPCGIAAKSMWTLNSWDAFMIPRPFTRVRIAAGDPIRVPGDLNREELRGLEEKLRETLMKLNDQAARFG